MKFNINVIANIIGILLMINGFLMLTAVPFGIYHMESTWKGMLVSSFINSAVGFLLYYRTKDNKNKDLRRRDGYLIVTSSWVFMCLFGLLPYIITNQIPNLSNAFFETVSGYTTTGATILDDIESLDHSILYWRSLTQWIGGMGIIVFYIAILPLLGVGGVQLFKAEVPGPVADKIKPRVKETAKFLWIIYVGITLAEMIALRIAGMETFDAICHAFTTMPTGGFSTKNASIAYYNSPMIHYIIILFMFLAGINFSLHFKAINGDIKIYFKDKEFLVYLLIIVFVSLIILLTLSYRTNTFSDVSLRESLFGTIAILTGTGYVLGNYEIWPIFLQMILLVLMFIGGMGGSTTGGMKVIRVLLLVKYAALETRRMLHSRALLPVKIGKQLIKEDVVRNTLGFFLFFMSAFIISSILLSTMGLDIESSIGAAASAMGNIGPALGEFGPTDNYALMPNAGKWLLTFCMLLGRLELFTVIVLFSKTYWK